MLYSQIFQYLLTRPEVAELTLEDPSESFEDLRDREDLKLLIEHKVFDEKPLSELIHVSSEWYEATRRKWKFASVSHRTILESASSADRLAYLEAIREAARTSFAMEIYHS